MLAVKAVPATTTIDVAKITSLRLRPKSHGDTLTVNPGAASAWYQSCVAEYGVADG